MIALLFFTNLASFHLPLVYIVVVFVHSSLNIINLCQTKLILHLFGLPWMCILSPISARKSKLQATI